MFSTLASGKVETLRNVDSYQMRYFHPETGSLSFEGRETVEAPLVTASVFTKGSLIVIITLAGVALLAAAAAIIYKRKKSKGGEVCNGEE